MVWAIIAAAVLLVVLLVIAAWAYQTATRLDRLHVRYDLSWQALDSALARRAVVARAAAANAYGDSAPGRELISLADAAERAPRSSRETVENELSARLASVNLAALSPGLIAELADAETRVLLARRFHNDAVRDTLALRVQRPVRWLRLGGHAPLPSYFEIVERAQASSAGDLWGVNVRTSARVVLLDDDGRVLLLCGSDPAVEDGTAPTWWFTIGGEAQPGEPLAAAAARELEEETGLRVDAEAMIGPVWSRDAIIEFNNSVIRSHELFFVCRTRRFDPSASGQTALERRYIHGHRWCDAADVAALVGAGQVVYPVQLGELLAQANAVADAAQRGQGPAEHEPQPIR